MCRNSKKVAGVGNGNYTYFWKSRGLSDENITTPIKLDYFFQWAMELAEM